MNARKERATARERKRIARLKRDLWQYVCLFDPKNSREHCHEYFPPNADRSGESLFGGCDKDMFSKDNRLWLAIDAIRSFPKMMRGNLDKYWRDVEFFSLDSEYIGLEHHYALVFQKLHEFLVYEAKRVELNDSAISMFCGVTWALTGTIRQREKLWEDRFCLAKWPDCGLETGRLPVEYHRDLLAGAAVIEQLSVQVKRWRDKLIVRFRTDAEYNGKPMIPGTIDEIPGMVAEPWLDHGWLEPATRSDLERYRTLMREVDKNEKTTAANELSRSICREEFERKVKAREEREKNRGRVYVVEEEILPADAPSLIVRFLRPEFGGDRSFSVGEVYPIEKKRALSLLLHVSPIVELASPEELKRDRELVDRLEAIRKVWDRKRIPQTDRLVQVRFLRRGKNPENGHICDPGETWDVGFDTAYLLSRGGEPLCEILIGKRSKPSKAKSEVSSKTARATSQNETSRNIANLKAVIECLLHHHVTNDGESIRTALPLREIQRRSKIRSSETVSRALAKFKTIASNESGHEYYERMCATDQTLKRYLNSLLRHLPTTKNKSV